MSVFIQRPVPPLRAVHPALADTLPDPFVPPEPYADSDELEDTQPSMLLPDDDDFCDAPTIPGFKLRADGRIVRDSEAGRKTVEGQWDRALRAVAVAVKRVFASHSIRSAS